MLLHHSKIFQLLESEKELKDITSRRRPTPTPLCLESEKELKVSGPIDYSNRHSFLNPRRN